MPHFSELIEGEFHYVPLKKNPRVVVLLTTYNRCQSLLPRAIHSVLDQTFKDFDLVILDDGSTDRTAEVVEGFQWVDSRVYFMPLNHSGIPAVSLNVGLRNFKGDYYTWLCDDDVLKPHFLATLVTYLDKNLKFVAAYTAAEGVPNVPKHEGWIFDRLLMENFIPGTMMWRKGVSPRFHESPRFKGYEDWIAWLDLATYGQIGYYAIPGRIQYPTPGSISRSTKTTDHFKAVAAVYDHFIGRKSGRARAARWDAFCCRFPAPWRYPFAWIGRQVCLRISTH